MKTKVIRILLADDHPILRKGLRALLEENPEFRVVAEADDGEKTLRELQQTEVDVAIVDMDMPKLHGLEVVQRAMQTLPATNFVVLTMHKDETLFNKALDFGVRGFVLKDNAVTDIVHCVQEVAAGGYFISSSISGFLLKRQSRTAVQRHEKNRLEDLTETERTILKLLAEMKTSRQIAEELFISPKTVENHRTNISKKLGLQGYQVLLKFALENKTRL
ncbi:MAG: response regulator transcription factor [Bacteroidetes bacterium]|nr:MAG: response regulator transcription factor [Bacteroidota bacterium]